MLHQHEGLEGSKTVSRRGLTFSGEPALLQLAPGDALGWRLVRVLLALLLDARVRFREDLSEPHSGRIPGGSR